MYVMFSVVLYDLFVLLVCLCVLVLFLFSFKCLRVLFVIDCVMLYGKGVAL